MASDLFKAILFILFIFFSLISINFYIMFSISTSFSHVLEQKFIRDLYFKAWEK